jgi:hypothetical protein
MACRARSALLARQQQQAADREAFGRAWQDIGQVFTTRSGLPVEPRNLVHSFRPPPLVLLQHFRANVRLPLSWAMLALARPALLIELGPPRASRTADLELFHAARCRFRYSSWTSCGVRYPRAE